MLHTIARFLKFCFYAALVLAGVTFCVENRTRIDLSFFPFPSVTLPLFLFAIVIFALGVLLGWLIARYGTLKKHFLHKDSARRIEALENEVAAMRSEQLIKPAPLPPQ